MFPEQLAKLLSHCYSQNNNSNEIYIFQLTIWACLELLHVYYAGIMHSYG